jgi:hypothetical protein
MQTASEAWEARFVDRDAWGPAAFTSLLTGEAACVAIDDFYAREACRAIAENVLGLGLKRSFTCDNTEASFSGLAAMECVNRREDYLAAVAETNAERRRLLGDQADPMEEVLSLLREAWPAGARIAAEGGRPYFAGVVRIIKKVVHHSDSAPRDLPGWSVAGIKHQLSWNLYLSAPEEGGELQVWRRRWREEDERTYRYPRAAERGYRAEGYRPEVVEGWPYVVVPPRAGRLVLFNALYYHKVLDVAGARPRLAMSSFVGVTDEGSPLVLWS